MPARVDDDVRVAPRARRRRRRHEVLDGQPDHLHEDMAAVGKTPSQLARDIEIALGKYVKTPKVNVVVMTALSVYSEVKVIGQVKEPQALPYHEGMTVLDALLSCKGLSQFAAGNRARFCQVRNLCGFNGV